MKDFGWCFIGTGSIAFTVAKELIKNDNSYIASCFNRTKEKALKFSLKYGGKVYDNAIDAMNDENVKCVYIAVTNDKHFEYALMAIKAKKNVLVEKPFTINKMEAIKLINAAKENDVYIAEAMWTWFNDSAIKARELRKEIGEIKYAKMNFGFPIKSITKKGRLWDIELGGGALLDLGVYPIRYAYELFGKPKEIVADAELYNGIDTNTKILFKYDGFNCLIKTSSKHILSETAVIKGEDGNIKVPFFHTAHKVICTKNNRRVYRDKSLLYGKQFAIVENEILTGKKESDYVSLKSTLDIMEIMDNIRKRIGVIYSQDLDD